MINENIELGLISGWKNIARFCGVSIRTAKRYHYKYSMPIFRWPAGTPVVIPSLVIEWLVIFNRLEQERHGNGTENKKKTD